MYKDERDDETMDALYAANAYILLGTMPTVDATIDSLTLAVDKVLVRHNYLGQFSA